MKRLFLGLSVAVIALSGCHRSAPVESAVDRTAIAVQLETVRLRSVATLLEVPGTVRSRQRAGVSARVTGVITALPVALGQRVAVGELLVSLESGDWQARLDQAEAQCRAVRREVERERQLLAKGASTAETVRALEDRLSIAEAALREAAIQMSYTQIRSPYEGVVVEKPVRVGDLASPGRPLLTLEAAGDLEIEVYVPESLASTLSLGAPLRVLVDGASSEATLRELSPVAVDVTRTREARLALSSPMQVNAGAFVRVQFPGAPREVLVVPETSVRRRGDVDQIFVHEAGRARLRLVRLGAMLPEGREVVAGIRAGDLVVVNPPSDLVDGALLREVRP